MSRGSILATIKNGSSFDLPNESDLVKMVVHVQRFFTLNDEMKCQMKSTIEKQQAYECDAQATKHRCIPCKQVHFQVKSGRHAYLILDTRV